MPLGVGEDVEAAGDDLVVTAAFPLERGLEALAAACDTANNVKEHIEPT